MHNVSEPFVSIIITCFNGMKWIEQCLNALLSIDYSHYEIIFVDNGSHDETYDFVKSNFSHPKIVLKHIEKNRGFTGGNNYGFQHAKGEFVLFVSIDVIVPQNIIKELLSSYSDNCAIVGPAIVATDFDNFSPEWNTKCPPNYMSIDYFGYPLKNTKKIFYIEGCVFLMKKELFARLNGFDEALVTFAEDVDLSWRTWIFGYDNIINENVKIYHYEGSSSVKYRTTDAKLQTTYYRRYNTLKNMIRNMLKNYQIHNIIWILPGQLLFYFMESIYYLLVQRNLKAFMMIYKAILWNVVNIRGTLKYRKFVQQNRKRNDKFLADKLLHYPAIFHYYFKHGAPKYVG